MAVAITRRDVSVGDLRREVGRTQDAKAARRMLAIACVMAGQSREDAAETCGVEPSGSPDMARDGVVRWRCVGLQERTKREWDVSLHERTVGTPGKALALPVRPQHPKSGPEAQAPFGTGSPAFWNRLMSTPERLHSGTT